METNELPEEVKRNIDEKVDIMWGYSLPEDLKEAAEFGYRLALQSKEARIKFLEGAFDDMLKTNEGHVIELQSKEEEILDLEMSVAKSINREAEWQKLNMELKEQLKAKDEELAKLTSALRDWGHKAEGWNKLESENERLRGLLEKCRPLAFHSTLDPKQNWNNQATELLQEIDLLSQSTDKP